MGCVYVCVFNCAYLVNTRSLEDVSNMSTFAAYCVSMYMYTCVLQFLLFELLIAVHEFGKLGPY